MAEDISEGYIIQNMSGSNEQHTDHNGVPLTLPTSEGAPLVRLDIRGPINLRGRPADEAYKITVG